ncbi:hypothetical protein B938_09350 [Bacillus velezensis AS43.3]|nr:hypothetical protein B938_09350 [Bacillus velezensis AS43.3]ODB63639.1 hypothetical protein A7313_04020 [Bacillus velezensis]QIR33155.1 hypothetical protein BVELS4_01897 [Bacillus velezensis]
MIGWGSEPDFISRGCSGWQLSYLLICGEPMQKLIGKKQGRCGKVLSDMILFFVYAFKKEEILFG